MFYGGIFRVTPARQLIDLKLIEELAPCPGARVARRRRTSRSRASCGATARAPSAPPGSYSAATVRGTKWLVQDTCAGTLTRVTEGVVAVRDKRAKKTVLVAPGKAYLASARR